VEKLGPGQRETASAGRAWYYHHWRGGMVPRCAPGRVRKDASRSKPWSGSVHAWLLPASRGI